MYCRMKVGFWYAAISFLCELLLHSERLGDYCFNSSLVNWIESLTQLRCSSLFALLPGKARVWRCPFVLAAVGFSGTVPKARLNFEVMATPIDLIKCSNRQAPDEGQMPQWPKHCVHNKKDEHSSWHVTDRNVFPFAKCKCIANDFY